MILSEKSLKEWKVKGLVDRTITLRCRPGNVKYSIKKVVSPTINKSPKLEKLCKDLLDFRKLMLLYRLIHYKDKLPDIKIELKNRDEELSYPILQLFYGTDAFEEVKKGVEYFIRQRHERRENTIAYALYPIIESLIYPTGKKDKRISGTIEIPFSSIWNYIIKDWIPGHYDVNKPFEYDTKDYGKLYNRNLSSLVNIVFGTKLKHSNKGVIHIFDLDKLRLFEERYGIDKKDSDNSMNINVELDSDEK